MSGLRTRTGQTHPQPKVGGGENHLEKMKQPKKNKGGKVKGEKEEEGSQIEEPHMQEVRRQKDKSEETNERKKIRMINERAREK